VACASFHGVLDAPPERGRAARRARVEIYHGTLDPFSDADATRACVEDLRRRGLENVRLIEFEGCRHAFTRPEKIQPSDLAAGFAYDARAAEESWASCVRMLEEAFGAE
jgi:dienelactone hydrolase